MTKIPIRFTYFTGLKRNIFDHVRLVGSWNEHNHYSEQWTSIPMREEVGEDGCPCFTVTVQFDAFQAGYEFRWGVVVDSPSGSDLWAIPTEVNQRNSSDRYRSFTLRPHQDTPPQHETYYLTHCRRLGAQKYYLPGKTSPVLRFAVWAPHAQSVHVVFGNTSSGYIDDEGFGMDATMGPFTMVCAGEGIWQTCPTVSPKLVETLLNLGMKRCLKAEECMVGDYPIVPPVSNAEFSKLHRKPYMYRIVKEDGQVAFRTDLYSRCQIGQGNIDPLGQHYSGKYTELDGTKSCSVVVDPDTVTKQFQEPSLSELEFVSQEKFWKDEFSSDYPVPRRVEDLVIYELHLGALGYGKDRPGNLQDAMELLPYLVELGVNAIELLPLSEFRDKQNWGYETSHYFALEYSAGGRDHLKHFVRECHQHGIAVILDVVYNHYTPNGERAEWAYDSNQPEHNIYYWYEGNASSYAQPDGGYLDNWSTGFAPRFCEEMVRKMFISSAAMLMEEFHVDGFRVDQTTSMHQYNVLHANGQSVSDANIFGAKFLREWTRTLKLINPDVILIAEDHSNWEKVTASPDQGGLGFDATWYADFYHHLIGDTRQGSEYARLIPTAGYGTDEPLAMDQFASVLAGSGHQKVVYHESHDEAGNAYYEADGNRIESKRTISSAVNGAPLVGETRRVAEARSRVAAGLSILSAGTPMFLMGEEIGAQKPYRYTDFSSNREDLLGEKATHGARLFRFYQDLIRLRREHSGLRSRNIEIIHVHNTNRVIAFRRWDDQEEFLIIASLNNHPFTEGYTVRHPSLGDRTWKEIFNSDAEPYGGNGLGNYGTAINSLNRSIHVVVPANGLIAFQKF
ncbi:MAG: alpha-amylase family glycosyl hydrolase [Kovacikia sp.]